MTGHTTGPRSSAFVPFEAIRRHVMIASGEVQPTAYFFALFFLLGAGFALARGSANSLFLQRFGIENLPAVLVILSLGLAAAGFGHAAVADRIRPDRLFAGLLAVVAVAVLPLWVVMAHAAVAQSYAIYFALFQIASELLLLQATLYFGMSFDSAQSKRLLPVALAGLQAGEMGGGLGLAALATALPAQHIALLWCALLGLAAALVALRHRKAHHPMALAAPARRSARPYRAAAAQIAGGLRFARSSPLMRNLALATLFTVLAFHILEYCTLRIYSDAFRSEEELAIVFGLLTFTCGAVTLLVQIFFSGRLMRRYGVRAVNLVLPVSLLGAFLALAASFKVLPALAGSLVQRTILPALRNPSRSILFQAFPDHMQGRTRALILALIVPGGILGAAFVVRAVPQTHQSWLLPLAGLLAAAAYLAYSIAANARYPAALLETLGEKFYIDRGHLGRLDPMRDHELFERLLRGLGHADEEVALAHAHALLQAFPDDAWRHVLERARNASPAVMDQLVRLAAVQLPAANAGILREFLGGADDHARATVLSLLFGARDPKARPWVEDCLNSENPRLIACGIQGAHDYALDTLVAEARARWRQLLESNEPSQLIAGLALARAHPRQEWIEALLRAQSHAIPRIRQVALEALAAHASIADGLLAPWVRAHLGARAPDVRAHALRCAVDLPPLERLAAAQAALGDPHPRVREAALDRLREHHGPAFAASALDRLADNSLAPRAQRVLIEWLLAHPAPARRLSGYALRRSQESLLLAASLHRLRHAGPQGESPAAYRLLCTALEELAIENADLALHALEGNEDRTAIRRIRGAIRSRNMRHLARAAEVLEGLHHAETAAALRSAIEHLRGDLSGDASTGPMSWSLDQVVSYLSQYPDAFLRDCASHAHRTMEVSPA